jgi:hypothetical protein
VRVAKRGARLRLVAVYWKSSPGCLQITTSGSVTMVTSLFGETVVSTSLLPPGEDSLLSMICIVQHNPASPYPNSYRVSFVTLLQQYTHRQDREKQHHFKRRPSLFTLFNQSLRYLLQNFITSFRASDPLHSLINQSILRSRLGHLVQRIRRFDERIIRSCTSTHSRHRP